MSSSPSFSPTNFAEDTAYERFVLDRTHDDAALRHQEAALHWDAHGDPEHAELERRNVEIERAAAQLERDGAALIQRRRPAPTA